MRLDPTRTTMHFFVKGWVIRQFPLPHLRVVSFASCRVGAPVRSQATAILSRYSPLHLAHPARTRRTLTATSMIFFMVTLVQLILSQVGGWVRRALRICLGQ